MPNFSYFPLLFLLLPLLLTFHATAVHNLIPETCKKCADNPNISYKFCAASLQAANHSLRADLRGLGMISIRLTIHNVTDTKHYIQKLLKDEKLKDPFVRACLNDCHGLYSDSISTLIEAMDDYIAKNYDDANIKVSYVMTAATTCEDGFHEKEGVVSPLTKRYNDTFQLSAIALCIFNMVRYSTFYYQYAPLIGLQIDDI